MKSIIKALLLVLFLQLIVNSASAQVFDGMTQPTTWRFWTPVSLSIETDKVNAAPFMGYKIWINNPSTSHLSTTAIFQYNFTNQTPSIQSWNNVNLLKRKVWFMSRTGYDIGNDKLWETLSGTVFFPYRLNIDFTWSNFFYFQNGFNFLDNDKLQIVVGYKLVLRLKDGSKRSVFAFNIGARIRGNTTGIVTNLRLYIQKTNWLQFRYDFADKVFMMSAIIQFN